MQVCQQSSLSSEKRANNIVFLLIAYPLDDYFRIIRLIVACTLFIHIITIRSCIIVNVLIVL